MFSLFKKKPGKKLTVSIKGMHCTSCAINIDGVVEDIEGVLSANTSYAKSTTTIHYNPEQTNTNTILKAIKAAGYEGTISNKD